MQRNGSLKAIFFDLGQTLVEELSPLAVCMRDSLKKHLPQVTRDLNELVYIWGYETHKLFMKLREKEFMSARKIHLLCLKNMLKTENIHIADKRARSIVEGVWQDFIRHSTIYPDTIPVLSQLKESGYTLGLITDCDLDVADDVIQKHNLAKFFDVKVTSGALKAYKPNTLLFKEALKLAKCAPHQGVYVGDSEIDIKGAKEMGLITVIVDEREMKHQKVGIRPNFRINRLLELPKLISRLGN